jgi:NOL1/NOP2/fmu family ribosome biogenesis protein
MRKTGPAEKPRISVATPSKAPLVRTFIETYLDPAILTYLIGDRIYGASNPLPLLTGLNVTQIGAYIGQVINQRIEIDHAFATSKIANRCFRTFLDLDESETQRFLKGETLFNDTVKGYVLLRYKGKIFALGKGDGQQIKNKFPKGLRTLQKFSENI